MSRHAPNRAGRDHGRGPEPGNRTTATGTSLQGGADRVLALQRAAGNRATARLLQAGGGRPLDADTRAEMESRFGQDFGRVRVHTDPIAEGSAQALGAKAYTVGQNIGFGSGRYAPSTGEGRRLLAHELAHVVQQGRGGGERPTQDGSGPLERAAGDAATSFSGGGGPVAVRGAGAPGVACAPDEEVPLWKRAYLGAREKVGAAAGAIEAAPEQIAEGAKATYAGARQEVGQVVQATEQRYQATKDVVADELKRVAESEGVQQAVGVARELLPSGPNGVLKDLASPAAPLARASAATRKLTQAAADRARGDPKEVGRADAVNNLVTAADKFLQARTKLDTEPMKQGVEAGLKDGPIAGVQAWQKGMDRGLKDLTGAFKEAVNDFEDGKFQPPPRAIVDPAAHPTLAKAEQGVLGASEGLGSIERQVTGGTAKALWSMGAGLSGLSVHPYEAVKGIVELTEISLNPSLLLIDPSARAKVQTMAKGMGENYIEASGHKLNPQTGAIEAGGKTRWGELPGLLAVDVGSFFIPGAGEAKAAGEVLDTAGAISKVGDVGAVAGKVGDVGGVASKVGDLGVAGKVGDVEKGLQAGTDATKAADTAKALAEGEQGVGEAAKGSEVGSDAAKGGTAPAKEAPKGSPAADLKEGDLAPAADKTPGAGTSEPPKVPAADETKAPGAGEQAQAADPAPKSDPVPPAQAPTQPAYPLGNNRAAARRSIARRIMDQRNAGKPSVLDFLVDKNGKLKSGYRKKHSQLIETPGAVDMGHAISDKAGQPTGLMIQDSWGNQLNRLSVERPGMGAFMENIAVEIDGWAVELETARMWEEAGLLQKGTVKNARRVNPGGEAVLADGHQPRIPVADDAVAQAHPVEDQPRIPVADDAVAKAHPVEDQPRIRVADDDATRALAEQKAAAEERALAEQEAAEEESREALKKMRLDDPKR